MSSRGPRAPQEVPGSRRVLTGDELTWGCRGFQPGGLWAPINQLIIVGNSGGDTSEVRNEETFGQNPNLYPLKDHLRQGYAL